MESTVQGIFQAGFETYADTHALPLYLRKAGRALMDCRTATLGGHIQACPHGHVEAVWYNSCKHRCCPQCNRIQIERWLEGRKSRLLACPHRHVIFTLPHELHGLWRWNTSLLSDILFQAVRETLMELTGDKRYLGATPGFVSALHTWGRSLALHPHLHVLITEGGLDGAGQWGEPVKRCFLPARVVMALFRGKYLAGVREALEADLLRLPEGETAQRIKNLLNRSGRKKWNVRVGERYAHGEGVATYLARYVRGGALHNGQILEVTATEVIFRYYPHGEVGEGKRQGVDLSLSHAAFIQRYLQHVPEPGRQVVRSYGLYANGKRTELERARRHRGQTPVEAPEFLDWQSYCERVQGGRGGSGCPVCGQRLVVRARIAGHRHDPPLVGSGFSRRAA